MEDNTKPKTEDGDKVLDLTPDMEVAPKEGEKIIELTNPVGSSEEQAIDLLSSALAENKAEDTSASNQESIQVTDQKADAIDQELDAAFNLDDDLPGTDEHIEIAEDEHTDDVDDTLNFDLDLPEEVADDSLVLTEPDSPAEDDSLDLTEPDSPAEDDNEEEIIELTDIVKPQEMETTLSEENDKDEEEIIELTDIISMAESEIATDMDETEDMEESATQETELDLADEEVDQLESADQSEDPDFLQEIEEPVLDTMEDIAAQDEHADEKSFSDTLSLTSDESDSDEEESDVLPLAPISDEQIEKAIERVIETKYTGAIEKMIAAAVEKVVTQEIEKIKRALMDDDLAR